MTDMTMGQRIAVQRKLKNLSQEALAEQLEVSRQAVSKWESDAAIPEVDKLIALGKIFGVSVGWLLGTEKEITEETEFTEAQIRAVEEIVSRSLPKRRSWLPWVACILLAAVAVWGLRNPKEPAQDDAVAAQMEDMQSQIDDLNAAVQIHMEESDILTEVTFTAEANKSMNKAEVTFWFTPKVYRETDDAYLVVHHENDVSALWDSTLCEWNGTRYTVTVPLERKNGYVYTFRLENESGFRDQSLMRPGFTDVDYISNISDNMAFRIHPDHPKYAQMANLEYAWLDVDQETYTYDAPILTPRIFPKDGRGYEDIQVVLRRNGEVIWQESCLDAVMELTGASCVSLQALPLDISVDLPELACGDKLDLALEAELIDGTRITTPLDALLAGEQTE